MIDFSKDQLYPLLEASCPVHKASSNGLVCQGDTIRLYADSGTAFRWRGPGTYSSFYQNPIIPDAVPAMSGSYSAIIQSYGCLSDTVYTEVVVNNLPSVSITSKGDPMCEDENRQLDGFPPGGIFNVISGPGLLSSDLLSVSDTGTIDLLYSYNDVCTALAYQSIRVNSVPSVNAGSSQDLKVVFETHFNAELTKDQTGEWSVVSGNGQIDDMNSPVSAVTGLVVGENVFLWTVHEGNCISSAEVTIKVSDLFLPSVITPNGDGKNDLFKVNGPEGKMELVIFSRWGNVEYGNHDYQNTWDGRNNRGAVMPYDTYMYIVKFSNGLTRKGTVLIVR
jgi:gliding motility-associated-like protein